MHHNRTNRIINTVDGIRRTSSKHAHTDTSNTHTTAKTLQYIKFTIRSIMCHIISHTAFLCNMFFSKYAIMANTQMHTFFRKYNANPWKRNLPDCAIRATSLAINMPYVDVCKKLRVSYKNGHGLIRDSGIYLQKIKSVFDDYFDVVVDFSEELPDEFVPQVDYDTTNLFDDDDNYEMPKENNEIDLIEWMSLNRGSGLFVVGLHNPIDSSCGGHLVCASTNKMQFYDTWDCSEWKVDAWMRVRKRIKSEE